MASSNADGWGNRESITQRITTVRQQQRSSNLARRRDRGSVLVCVGPETGKLITFDRRPIIIGRAADSDLTIRDPSVSRCHLACYRNGGAFYVEDLGTSNGTWRDGCRLEGVTPIRDGDRLLLGHSALAFSTLDANEQQAARTLRDQASRDPLTGLWNRRQFGDLAPRMLSQAACEEASVAMFMVDIDHFKRVNDRYGHLVGDAVLTAVAQRLRANLRPEDLVARFGGEEFAILAHCESRKDAMRTAHRLCRVIAAEPIGTAQGVRIPVTVSIGVHFREASCEKPVGDLLDAADGAMYVAKRQGRDRAVCSTEAFGQHARGASLGAHREPATQH